MAVPSAKNSGLDSTAKATQPSRSLFAFAFSTRRSVSAVRTGTVLFSTTILSRRGADADAGAVAVTGAAKAEEEEEEEEEGDACGAPPPRAADDESPPSASGAQAAAIWRAASSTLRTSEAAPAPAPKSLVGVLR
jgi:hypothetical protein